MSRSSVAIVLPNRIVLMLSVTAAGLVAVYITLMLTTIFFAAWQTQLASGIDDSRERIHRLEDQYYQVIDKIDATDPGSMGLVAPHTVEYVVAARMPGLTFADR